MRPFSIRKTLILVSILAIPGFLFFYLLPRFAKNRYKSLPIFGQKVVAPTFHSVKGKKIPDTVYHIVPDFKLLNQESKEVNWKSLEGKIVVLNLFDYSEAAQKANQNMEIVKNNYPKNDLIRLVSISVDIEDQPKRLLDYAASFKAKAGKWDFLSGDSSVVYPWIRDGLLLDVLMHRDAEGKAKYIYGHQFILLDNARRIRGFYEAGNPEAMAKLDDEIKVLVAEDLRNLKDGR